MTQPRQFFDRLYGDSESDKDSPVEFIKSSNLHNSLITKLGQPLTARNNEHDTNPGIDNLTDDIQPPNTYIQIQGFASFLARRRRKEGRPRRQRTTFSGAQTVKLEHEYLKSEYVSRGRRYELAAMLELTESQIKIWYQNRRAKDKRIEKAQLDQQYRLLWNKFLTPVQPATEYLRRTNHFGNSSIGGGSSGCPNQQQQCSSVIF